jgi:hypothetical protein
MESYRPDRVVSVLTSLSSTAFFGLLVLGVVVLIGLLVAKLVAGDDPAWVIGLTVPVVSVDADATVLTRWGNAQLEADDIRGSLRLPVSMLPWWLFAVLWTYTAAAMALTLLLLHHLRRIFQRVRSGAPFDATNARRLRWVGLLALALALLNGLSEFVTSLAVRSGLISERLEVPVGLSVDMSLVFFGLVLLALAEIFRRGAELEENQSLTV